MNILIEDPDLKIVDVHPKDLEEEISGFIRRCELLGDTLRVSNGGWRVSFSGWNDDPRELIQIPEARAFARRLINLGFLTVLLQPKPDNPYIVQDHIPGFDGIGLHAVAAGFGEVRKRGKKINIGIDIDISAYFEDLLTGLTKRNAPADVRETIKRMIARQRKLNPLTGSTSMAASTIMDVEAQKMLQHR